MHDALIVGAGPAGTNVARQLAERGHDVLVVEEHEVVGEPVQCGGLLTPRLVELVPADIRHLFLASFRRAHIHAPDGTRLALASSEVQQIACDRAGLDRTLAELARQAGAALQLGAKVVGAERSERGIKARILKNSGNGPEGAAKTVEARLLVGADGAQSRVAKWFSLFTPKQYISLHGGQLSGLHDLDPGAVEMWLGRERAPGFFSYIVPTGEGVGKVEVGTWNAPRASKWYFDRMFEDPASAHHLEGATTDFVISATIPFGPTKKSVAERVMLVGDAAGQAKPTTGGGIYPALVCGNELVEVADAALADDDLSRERLQAYHDAWYAGIGRELRIGLRLRHAFLQLDDEQVNDLWSRLSRPEVTALLNAAGDIDYPSQVAFRLLKEEPGLFKFAPPLLKGFLAGSR